MLAIKEKFPEIVMKVLLFQVSVVSIVMVSGYILYKLYF
jgi:hypothetical protein